MQDFLAKLVDRKATRRLYGAARCERRRDYSIHGTGGEQRALVSTSLGQPRSRTGYPASDMDDPRAKLVGVELDPIAIDHADIKSDEIELWAIRCPPGFDVSQLEGLDMSAAGTASGDGFEVRTAPMSECESVVSVFPSAKKKRYLVGKQFARNLVVSMPPPPAAASAAVLPPPLPPVPPPQGLRLRNMFLGGTLPPARAQPAPAKSSRKRSAPDAGGGSAAAAEGGGGGETAEAKAARKAAKKARKADGRTQSCNYSQRCDLRRSSGR